MGEKRRYLIQSHGDGYDLWLQDTVAGVAVTPLCDDTPENYQQLKTLQARLETSDQSTPARFQTMRHIETVRNYLNLCIKELLTRQEQHDQSKLESPEVEAYDAITHRLRGLTYGSDEYTATLQEYAPAIQHHYRHNRHHPEWHKAGIAGMTLIDLVEMLCDWRAASLRHADGDLFRSIAINQERFGYSDEVRAILENTALWLEQRRVYHKAEES